MVPAKRMIGFFKDFNIWLITFATVIHYELHVDLIVYLLIVVFMFDVSMLSEIVDWTWGNHPRITRFYNIGKRVGRKTNDTEMETLIRDVRGLYTVLIDQQVPEHIQRAMAHHEGEMYYCTHVEKMVRGNETELKGCPICQEFMDNE